MRAYEIFASLTPERATEVLEAVRERSPGVYTQAVAAASVAFKARPRFLMTQPHDKRAHLVRRALARVAANDLAEEVLAAYFLESRKPLLVEWLDAAGVPHEDGTLQGDEPPAPPRDRLEAIVRSFLDGEGKPDRELLLRAFAAQSAVTWPELETLLARP